MKTHLVIIFLVVTFFAAKAQQQDQDIVQVGQIVPEFTIVSDNGNALKSSSLKGKVILINFFATWCPPCQKELAEVQESLWPKYQNNKDFIMLTIGREHTDADLNTYNEKKGFTFPLYPDKDRSIYDLFAKSLIPRTYLIGKDGKIIYKTVGFKDEDFKTLMQKIETAIK